MAMKLMNVSMAELLKGYAQYLEVKYPAHFGNFKKRIVSADFSCRAEAAIFSVLRSRFDKVIIAEDVKDGGADFLCEHEGTSVLVEVTALDSGGVERVSGLQNVVSTDGKASSFHLITAQLRYKAVEKASQMANHNGPRLLVICSEHIDSSLLMGITGAEFLMTSDQRISFPIGAPESLGSIETDLKDSVFFRLNADEGKLESCRRSISAIALCCLDGAGYSMVGLLHPDPVVPWPLGIIPHVPFVKLAKWPPQDNKLQIEWVINDPFPFRNHYWQIQIKDEELKSK
jgi:hypothetical protein